MSCQLFYKELTRTQLFYDCIMNLSFASELEPGLADAFAFFAEICSKLNSQSNRDEDIRLIDLNESSNNQTVFVLKPDVDAEFLSLLNNDLLSSGDTNEIINNSSAFIYDTKENCFPKLKIEVYLSTNSNANSSVDLNKSYSGLNLNENLDSQKNSILHLAETQSISSSNTQIQFKRLSKIANTPIGVRTKAEKLQAINVIFF